MSPEERGGFCFTHGQVHEIDDEGAGLDEYAGCVFGWDRSVRRPSLRDWVMMLTVCWWRHRTRRVGQGLYMSHECRSCARWRGWARRVRVRRGSW